MFAFGTGMALRLAGSVSTSVLSRWRPGLLAGSTYGQRLLGRMVSILGIAVPIGADKLVEGWAPGRLPRWAASF